MRKTIFWTLFLSLLGLGGWFGYKMYFAQGVSSDVLTLVPSNAIYCVASRDPIVFWNSLSGSKMWSHLQRNAYFASITSSANSLDSMIRDNDLLFNMIGSRQLMASAHMTGLKTHDFLFIVDLEGVSGIKFLNEYLTTFNASGYKVKKEKHGEESLIELVNQKDKSTLYISTPSTYLIASYNKKILLASLDAQTGSNLLTAGTFLELSGDIEKPGLFQAFINYRMLPKLMNCYSDKPNEFVNRIALVLKATSLNLSVDEDGIGAEGETFVNDSIESYVKTLAISGKGSTEFLEIAPQRTAFCLALGFDSFAKFMENFEKNLQEDVAEYKSYQDNLHQVESYLKISVQENLINWIGDEVALLEMQSSGKGLDNEIAVILKASNIEKARKDLAYIEKMVRRKTPVKFKSVEHRGFTINYLGMKGMFKILLGKFFARYDKPYFTIINNFVIFSSHPQALESMIDDYLDEKTLNKSDEFKTFRRKFDDEAAALVFLNTPVLFNTVKKMMDVPTRFSMEKNKDFITCFSQIGFQLVPEKSGFKTLFAEQFVQPEYPAETILITAGSEDLPGDTIPIDNGIVPTGESDPMELPYIYVKNVNLETYRENYPDSSLHFEVELKGGFKNGSYTEYYPNGEKKMTGNFNFDNRDGNWRLYDETGKLKMRRKYDDGKVVKETIKD